MPFRWSDSFRMLHVLFLFLFFIQAPGMNVFESEIIKKIFQQDPAFCFRPFPSEGCSSDSLNGTLGDSLNGTLGDSLNGTSSDDFNDTSPEPNTLAFLFTPRNPRHPEFLHACGGRLPDNTNFNPRHKTEIFVHGFLDGACRSAWMRETKSELFKRGFYNVILIDWTWGNGPDYNSSTVQTQVVGKQLAALIQNIMDQSGVGPENFHLVGHSLGAHVAGFAGKRVKNLRRITALDPALTPFQNLSREERLDSSDANLVDVIHTNGGTQPGVSLGDINPLGHADFYPNGGAVQESCRRHIVRSYLMLDFLYATISLVPRICSHMHAVQYYKATINPKGCEFVGVQCPDYESFVSGECRTCHKGGDNCALMGMNLEEYYLLTNQTLTVVQPRRFYLNTTIDYPYCDNSAIDFESTQD